MIWQIAWKDDPGRPESGYGGMEGLEGDDSAAGWLMKPLKSLLKNPATENL